jgi:lipopolysaccharide/colanic/teichoic acid biosynthesis glycosyltransferase
MRSKIRYVILAADVIWLLVAFGLANCLDCGLHGFISTLKSQSGTYVSVVGTSVVLWAIFFHNQTLVSFNRGWHFPALVSSIIVALAYLSFVLFTFSIFFNDRFPRFFFFHFVFFILAGTLVIRGVSWALIRSRVWSASVRRVVIIGQGRLAGELARKISTHPELMIEVVGFLSPVGKRVTTEGNLLANGSTKMRTLDVLNLLKDKKVRDLIITDNLTFNAETDKFLAACQQSGMRVQFVPHWFELYVSTARLREIDDVPLVSLESRNLSLGTRELKRVIDLLCGGMLLVVSLPVIVAIWLQLNRSKGAAFKKELRSGLHAKEFFLYRFNIDRWSPELVGYEKFLAEHSLTELPQLWNVIRGDMSLVGPRPESPDRVKHYTIWQRQRLSVKPGLTGLAQVSGLREQHSSEEKAHFDLQYIYRYSGFLDFSVMDFSIILETIWTVCYRPRQKKSQRVKSWPHITPAQGIAKQEVLRADSSQSS